MPWTAPRVPLVLVDIGEFGGVRVAYLGTVRDFGVIIEIFSGTPDERPRPDETGP